MLWTILVFVGMGAILNLIQGSRDPLQLGTNQGVFWEFLSSSGAWVNVLFFLTVTILSLHYSLGLKADLFQQISKTLKRAPKGLRLLAKIMLIAWCVVACDLLVHNLLSWLQPGWDRKYIEGTQFFRVWDHLHFPVFTVVALILFLILFYVGYARRAPWDRQSNASVTMIRKRHDLSKPRAKKLRKAERLVEKGKRYRAAVLFEKIGDEYAFRAGKLFDETGRGDRARAAFARAGHHYRKLSRYERSGEAFFYAEEWHFASVDLEIALKAILKKQIASTDRRQGIIEKYGEALFQDGQFEKAGHHYLTHQRFLQAASCFKRAGLADEAGKAYSKAGAHDKSFEVLSASGSDELAGVERGRWLMEEGRFKEAAQCFDEAGFHVEAAEAHEANGMGLAAAQAYQRGGSFEKAASLFLEIGDDESAIDCYEAMGEFKRAADLAAYLGLQDRQGQLYLKANEPISAMKSFFMTGDMELVKQAAGKLDLEKEKVVRELKRILETLMRQNRLKDTMLCLEASLEGRSASETAFPLFQLMAALKKKMGYAASAAEIQIKLAKLFPANEDLVRDATLASEETGIPFEEVESEPVPSMDVTLTQVQEDSDSEPEEPPEDATATQTFDQDFFLDLTSEGQLGRFELVNEIGRGGMGLVYKARDRRLDRLVAFKMLHPEFNKDPKTVLFFKREARFVAQLNHPNIVTLYDVGYQKGCFYLVMEYVDGITLTQLLKKYPDYIRSNFLALWYEAALGLQHAHESGVLHRDMKPSNIMITKDRHVKVMDFGLAKNADDTTEGQQPAWGTPAFLAPELSENAKASFQSDIYALGATFYLMATGRVPFTKTELVIQGDPPELPKPPAELVEGMNEDLSRTILKCLYRDPNERYRSVKELITALKLLGNMKVKLFK